MADLMGRVARAVRRAVARLTGRRFRRRVRVAHLRRVPRRRA
jgi:hypothetical protein